jgi:hypothetical protein
MPTLTISAGGSLGVGAEIPNLHAGDDGTTTRVCTVEAETAALFLAATRRTPQAGKSVGSFEGYTKQQALPHNELGALRIIFEGATEGQLGGRVAILTKADGSAEFSEKLSVHGNGNALLCGGIGAVASANRSGQASGSTVLTISGKTANGVLELATPATDAPSLVAGDLLYIHNNNTAGDKRVGRIQAIAHGPTANNRGGDLLLFTKADGGALSEAVRIKSDKNVVLAGSVTTGAPVSGAAPWKLGKAATVFPTNPDTTIEVEVGGQTYYLHAKTTND